MGRKRSEPFTQGHNLTSIEKVILHLLANGWTAREIASRENLSHRTVERYIESLRLKMNARNTPHLIACAFSKRELKIVRGKVEIATTSQKSSNPLSS